MSPLPAISTLFLYRCLLLVRKNNKKNVKAVAVDNGLGKIPEQMSLVYDYLFSFSLQFGSGGHLIEDL